MLNRFMISVAALALIAGAGLANAQGTMKNDSGAGAQPMEHSQSSGGATERGKESASPQKGTVGQAGGSMKQGEEKSSGAMEKSGTAEKSGGAMNKNAAEEKAGAAKGEHAQSAQDKSTQDKSKNMSQDTSKSGAQKDMKAEGSKSGTSTNNAENQKGTTSTNQKAQGQTSPSTNQNAQGQTSPGTNQNAQGQGSTNTTVGQAGAGAKLSTEQRTQITSAIREEHIAPVSNVNFSISVGTRIPREGIELHALPSRVVTVYPEWRTYKYVLVKDEIVIINPDTYEIVAVLNV
ncbi:DUF1236 domain-containing protein [Bradyrhizobium sp. CCBAU 45384]|uniref:DUF1236 domain-containing protein n=1 Tax=Bradyrhizobium sp. CCBAU 45384 TaxID=858428 RepID=UPI002306AAD6|nr:DUF1236 domain-containing protein [Bradyrhizobium sp. CCBAU 45384]MDA9412006.1 hypothetical protein [Bradyrhizobium sp. CCBAU 45384]